MNGERILYDSEHYRIVLHGELEHPVTIVGFQHLSNFTPTPEKPFPNPFMPASVTGSGIPANFVSFLVNKNNWYIDPDGETAALALAPHIAGTRVVT